MKTYLATAVIASAALWSAVAQNAPAAKPSTPMHPTRLLAKLADKVQVRAMTSALEPSGFKVRKHLKAGVVVLERTDPVGAGAAAAGQEHLLARMKALRDSGLFEYVEPDYRVQADAQPTDSAFADGTLWGLRNTGQSGGVSGADIGAAQAWDLTRGSTNVIVAIIDTGIRYTHQELASQMWVNPGEIPGNRLDDDGDGFVDNVHGMNAITGSGDPFDDNDHGTHVSGTIGAAANGGGPHVGVAWQVRLMACKFLGADGGGYTSDAIECIDFAVANGARVLNNSWGGGGFSQALADSIAAARAAGVLFVAAAGNNGANADRVPNYPSSYDFDNVVSVAALDRADNLASFSNYGIQEVDLGAPGVSIYSCTAGSDTAYDSFNGTSMATPHVSGVAALILARYPNITVTELRQRLLTATVPVPALAGRCVTGGRVNAYRSLTVAPDGVMELAVSTSTKPPLAAGFTVLLYVSVTDLAPIANATVSGQILGGGALNFSNNGLAPDAVSGDYIYSASLPVPSSGSNLTIRLVVQAPGKTSVTNLVSFAIRTPPANDKFANRLSISGSPTMTTGNNNDASREPGEPAHVGQFDGKSVWWNWTAPASAVVKVNTEGSSFDTVLAVYTGTAVSALTLVSANDDFGGNLTSEAAFAAVADTTYLIAVDGYNGASGEIRLSVTSLAPPGNDLFANRIPMTGTSNSLNGANVSATKEAGEPAHAGNPGGKSVWWSWTAPADGLAVITTDGSLFDTLLGVYTGSAVSTLNLIASDDDGGEGVASKVTFLAVAGTTYQIAVDGYGGASGIIQMNLNMLAPLQLMTPVRLADGSCRLWIRRADGQAIEPSRLAAVEIHASVNPTWPMASWTRLPGSLSAENGMARIDDTAARALSMRFYRVVERP